MAGRTAYEAVAAFVSPLQRAVSCVTPSILTLPGGVRGHGDSIDLELGSARPVRLRGSERVHLRVRLRMRVMQVGERGRTWEAQLAAYEYRLSDMDDRELLAYHWHPEGASPVRTPHLHFGPAAEVGHPALVSAHLPTGPVPLADVLRLAVESFQVEPLRRDWDRVLTAAAQPGA